MAHDHMAPHAIRHHLLAAEMDGDLARDARAALRDERMALDLALQSGDSDRIEQTRHEAVRVAAMWGVIPAHRDAPYPHLTYRSGRTVRPGDAVTARDRDYADMQGQVEWIDPETVTVRWSTGAAGRTTPAELRHESEE